MVTPAECHAAVAKLAGRFGTSQGGRADGLDRRVSADITDLGLRFFGHLHDGVLDDITTDDQSQAQIRLTMTSDNLLALAAGEVSLGAAWLSGRVKVHASFPDMLKLRTLL
jgi:hypothetical protein